MVYSWYLCSIYPISINIWRMKKLLPWILLLITIVLMFILSTFNIGSFTFTAALLSVVTGSLSILLFFKNYFDKRN